MSDRHSPAPLEFPGLTECTKPLRPVPTGPFTVAAMARLAHLTQGERLFTLRDKWPALKHHVAMMAKKSSNSGYFSNLWDL
jgi:hypothetical protein